MLAYAVALACIAVLFLLAMATVKALLQAASLLPPLHPVHVFLALAVVVNVLVFVLVACLLLLAASLACRNHHYSSRAQERKAFFLFNL